MAEERKAPLPGRIQGQAAIGSAGMGGRSSSKNLQDMQEERKMNRANMGQQVIANNQRNTARANMGQSNNKRGGLNEFANAPQYTTGGQNKLIRNNPGFQKPPAGNGAAGQRGTTPVGNAQQNGRVSRERPRAGAQATNAPFATNSNQYGYNQNQGGPKIVVSNTRLQRF